MTRISVVREEVTIIVSKLMYCTYIFSHAYAWYNERQIFSVSYSYALDLIIYLRLAILSNCRDLPGCATYYSNAMLCSAQKVCLLCSLILSSSLIITIPMKLFANNY